MKIEKYYELVGSGQQENVLDIFTGPIVVNLNEAAKVAEKFYSKIEVDEHTLSNRIEIAKISKKFHERANTLTEEVEISLELLTKRKTVVIESAHQPSLFPYSGTMIKPVLVHLIAEKLRQQGLSVVELFGLLDTDDIKTGWHRRTELPDISSKDGILAIRKDSPSKKLIFNAVPSPTLYEITEWKNILVNWVKQNQKRKNRNATIVPNDTIIDPGKENIFFEQIREIFDLWKEIQINADSYGLFNSLFLSQLINNYWNYPTLFIPYSSSIPIFEQEINKVIGYMHNYPENHNNYRKSIEKYIDIDFSELPQNYFPFWYICNCGIKIRLLIDNETVKGECEGCGMTIELKLNEINNHIMKFSPQAISRHLLFFEGLKPSAYISGWGAMPFTLVAKGIADDLSLYYPPIIPFRPNEQQYGIGKLKALFELKQRGLSIAGIEKEIECLEVESKLPREKEKNADYKKVKRELNDLSSIKNALNCYPSILDYWISFGIKDTLNTWEEFIKTHDF